MLTGAIVGVIAAVTLTFVNRSRARKGTGLPGNIEHTLRGRGGLTLKEVAQLMGKDSFFGRGEVAQALNALHGVGKVRVHPAPPGASHLKRVQLIKYEVIDRPAPR